MLKYGNLNKSDRKLPDRANYFTNPELLLFNSNCEIRISYKHILKEEDNRNRIPERVHNAANPDSLFNGAIDRMKKRILANYRLAVPQYYQNQIQLLLPLCLENEKTPDLALVVTKSSDGTYYQGHTCLTLDMAYNNARLIAKPDVEWLQLMTS